jgi:hypothetical protein
MVKKNYFSDDYMFSGLHAQENNSLYKTKKIPFSRDTIYLENESLNASYFKLLDANNTAINSTSTTLIFLKEHYFKRNLLFISDSITVESEIP